jgi:hypothetical protein
LWAFDLRDAFPRDGGSAEHGEELAQMAVMALPGSSSETCPPFRGGPDICASELAGVLASGGGDKGSCGHMEPVMRWGRRDWGEGSRDGASSEFRDCFGGRTSPRNSRAAALLGNDLRMRIPVSVIESTCHDLPRLRMGM